jgi:hypothetical protein
MAHRAWHSTRMVVGCVRKFTGVTIGSSKQKMGGGSGRTEWNDIAPAKQDPQGRDGGREQPSRSCMKTKPRSAISLRVSQSSSGEWV